MRAFWSVEDAGGQNEKKILGEKSEIVNFSNRKMLYMYVLATLR